MDEQKGEHHGNQRAHLPMHHAHLQCELSFADLLHYAFDLDGIVVFVGSILHLDVQCCNGHGGGVYIAFTLYLLSDCQCGGVP